VNRIAPETVSAGASQATGRCQPRRRPTQAIRRIESQERGHDQQDVDRARGVQERAPRRRDREDQGRHEEDQPRDDDEWLERPLAQDPRQPDQPMTTAAPPAGAGRRRGCAAAVDPRARRSSGSPAARYRDRSVDPASAKMSDPSRESALVAPGPGTACRRQASRGSATGRRRGARPPPGSRSGEGGRSVGAAGATRRSPMPPRPGAPRSG
jgi:hypothetical protein